LGKVLKKTNRRFHYVDFNLFSKELRKKIKVYPNIDCITISGSGEPTLCKDLGRVILLIKKITKNKYPVVVITNSTLLYRKDVIKDIVKADIIIPSLDACDEGLFRKINRPLSGISIKNIIDSLKSLRLLYPGKIWLEIMLVEGMNDSFDYLKRVKNIVRKINPDKVHINIPVRSNINQAKIPCKKKINSACSLFGDICDVLNPIANSGSLKVVRSLSEDELVNSLKRRPATAMELISSLNYSKKAVTDALKRLVVNKKVAFDGKYFRFIG